MKVMIVNAFGRSNRGDCVLLDECIAEVRAALPDATIGCAVFEGIAEAKAVHPDVTWSERIGNTPRAGLRAKLTTVVLMFVALVAVVRGFGWMRHALPRQQRDSWALIRDADVVISAPGGYIHDTNFAYYVALLHIALARRVGTRTILAPQSIGPIDAPLARRIARFVLGRADVICARESYSWNFLCDALQLPDRILRRSGDSAFWNHDVNTDDTGLRAVWRDIGLDPEAGGPILGLTVVDWSFPKSADPQAARAAYVDALAQIIDHMHSRHGMRAVIFNQVSEDLGMAQRVAEACQSRVIIDRVAREPDVLRALMSRATLFLGTRFHSCIFAMMAGVPTFAIAYLPKTSHILMDLKLDARQIAIDDMDGAAVIAALERDLRDTAKARAEIDGAVAHYRATHTRLGDVLREHP